MTESRDHELPVEICWFIPPFQPVPKNKFLPCNLICMASVAVKAEASIVFVSNRLMIRALKYYLVYFLRNHRNFKHQSTYMLWKTFFWIYVDDYHHCRAKSWLW